MTFALYAALAAATIVAQVPQTAAGSADLSLAKTLYASASYEEALTHLSVPDDAPNAEQVLQYRALCQLALGKADDAQRTLERIVSGNPLYRMTDTDVSPKVVAMFHDVRKRLLPAAARGLYSDAKTAFDQKQYTIASTQLKELLAILGDADLAGQAAGLSDLKLVADGFLRLSEAELAKAAAAPPPVPQPPPPVKPLPRIYAAGDAGVSAPVEVDRRMPAVNPASLANRNEYRGIIELVIDERGAVESAVLRRPVAPFYDAALVEAAKKWTYRPAKKDGAPVKFRKTMEIVLSPR